MLIIFLYAVEFCYNGNGFELNFSHRFHVIQVIYFQLDHIPTNLVSNEREKKPELSKNVYLYWVIDINKRYRAEKYIMV